MKYIKQFAIIAAITFLGEILNLLLPFPVPASIYGMIMLFVCLMTGILKLSQIEETAVNLGPSILGGGTSQRLGKNYKAFLIHYNSQNLMGKF